jgi:hypothetical protein
VALDAVAERHDPARVSALARGPVHAIGGAAGELPAVVVGHDGLDVVAEKVRLAFHN